MTINGREEENHKQLTRKHEKKINCNWNQFRDLFPTINVRRSRFMGNIQPNVHLATLKTLEI